MDAAGVLGATSAAAGDGAGEPLAGVEGAERDAETEAGRICLLVDTLSCSNRAAGRAHERESGR